MRNSYIPTTLANEIHGIQHQIKIHGAEQYRHGRTRDRAKWGVASRNGCRVRSQRWGSLVTTSWMCRKCDKRVSARCTRGNGRVEMVEGAGASSVNVGRHRLCWLPPGADVDAASGWHACCKTTRRHPGLGSWVRRGAAVSGVGVRASPDSGGHCRECVCAGDERVAAQKLEVTRAAWWWNLLSSSGSQTAHPAQTTS